MKNRRRKNRIYRLNKIEGIFDATALNKGYSFSYVKCNNMDVKVYIENCLNAYHNDLVKVKLYKGFRNNKRNEIVGKVTSVIKRDRIRVVGCLQVQSKSFLTEIFNKIDTDMIVINNSSKRYKPNNLFLAEVADWGNRSIGRLPEVKILEDLGRKGDSTSQITAIIRSYDMPLFFPNEIIKETENKYNAYKAKIKENKRMDLTGIMTLTIDPIDAKDYDDAVSIEQIGKNLRLYVHIADVSEFISPTLLKEAQKRGNSYYFPRRVIPMLPNVLSTDVCSLKENEKKLCLTVITDFDEKGEILKQQLVESIIQSNIRLTYDTVDKLFTSNKYSLPNKVVYKLNQMKELSRLITKNRERYSPIHLSIYDEEIKFNSSGEVVEIKRVEETESHKMIENFMITANTFIAKFLNKGIFRIHEKPDKEKVENIRAFMEDNGFEKCWDLQRLASQLNTLEKKIVFSRRILRAMKKAKYETKNIGHFALGLKSYTHFTSPIRRICDLIVHFKVKEKLKGKKLKKIKLHEISKIANECESTAKQSEADIKQFYKIEFMRKKLGECFKAIIKRIKKYQISVELVDYPIEVQILLRKDRRILFDISKERVKIFGKDYFLTDIIAVQILSVNKEIIGRIYKGRKNDFN